MVEWNIVRNCQEANIICSIICTKVGLQLTIRFVKAFTHLSVSRRDYRNTFVTLHRVACERFSAINAAEIAKWVQHTGGTRTMPGGLQKANKIHRLSQICIMAMV
jgi:hypothetical protein